MFTNLHGVTYQKTDFFTFILNTQLFIRTSRFVLWQKSIISALNRKLLGFPETSVSLYKATQRHRTKANILHNLHRESHISPIGM